MSNIFIGLKKTCLGVLDRGDRKKGNEIDLKEGEVIEIKTTVLHSLFVFILTLLHLNILLFDINLRTMTNPTCSVP